MNTLKQTISRLNIFAHIALTAVAFAAFRISNIVLDAFYARSQFPVPYQEGQTAFDGQLIKSYYQTMIDAGTLNIYWQTQFIDFAFMASLFAFGMIMPLLIRRMYRPKTIPYKMATLAATLIPLGTIFDAIENLWSFAMLSQPLTFPDWIAPIYSSFAVAKFAAIGSGYMLVFASIILFALSTIAKRLFRKSAQPATIALTKNDL